MCGVGLGALTEANFMHSSAINPTSASLTNSWKRLKADAPKLVPHCTHIVL